MDLKIYLDFLDIILGSSFMLQLMTLGFLQVQHELKHAKWLIIATVITFFSMFATMIASPMFQSVFAGAMFTGSLITFFVVMRGDHE